LCGFGELIASVVIVMQLYRSTIPTPLGDMLALASDEGLCALEFTDPTGSLVSATPGRRSRHGDDRAHT